MVLDNIIELDFPAFFYNISEIFPYYEQIDRQTDRQTLYLMWSSALSYVSWCTGTSLANGKKKTCNRLLLGSSIEYKSM